MADVTIRRAGAGDALIVAALHLQCARQAGMPAEPGYLDRFADAWLAERPDRPTWIAESGGAHAGVLGVRRIRPLPWPGRADLSWLIVETCFVVPEHRDSGVDRALVEGLLGWARTSDVTCVRLNAPDAADRDFYAGLGFTAPGRLMEFDLQEQS